MKKILFVLAMLLMSMTSALAEESKETFSLVYEGDDDNGWFNFSLNGEHFAVSGESMDEDGAYIDNDSYIAINAKNGEIITRVQLTISYGQGQVKATAGKVMYNHVSKDEVNEIYDVNETYLKIYSLGVFKDFQISDITIYYESGNSEEENNDNNTLVIDEYVQTESFSINGEPTYSGRKIKITGTGNGDGYQIADGKSVTITANSNVKIVKVDFGLGVRNNESPINSTAGIVEGSDKNWTINNINSSSLAISNSGAGKVQINSIKVYYVEMEWYQPDSQPCEICYVNDENSYMDNSYIGDVVTIASTEYDNLGMELADGNSVTITSNSSVEITKVYLSFSCYLSEPYKQIKSTAGDVVMNENGSYFIEDVNSSSLTISHPGFGESQEVQVEEITVYYKEKVPPTTIDVAAKFAGDGYWATFYSNACNYIAPKGTRVFKVHLDDDASITMTEIQDSVVAKGQGVVLKSTTGNISMSKTTLDSSGDYSRNSLMGTSVSVINPGNAYVLSSSSKYGVGFYKLSSNGTIGINRAYLVYNGSTEARSFFAFDDVTTGIEMNNVDNNKGNDKVYDLQGRRVTKPTNGIYIVNGKKVIMNRR